MSTINRSVRTATRNLRLPALQSRALRAPLSLALRASSQASPHTPAFRQFSAMAPLQSGAPPPPQAREYDPEIKNIASYVHHTPINSDLAVSCPQFTPEHPANDRKV
jgi:2-methylcitrate dehydratase